jgi:KDO2-lipid IV(A) lauroyltransferase
VINKLIYSFFYIIGSINLSILYFILYPIFTIFNFIFRYRKKIVSSNIKNSLLQLDNNQHIKVIRGFYKYFFNLLIEILKMGSVNQEFYQRRIKVINPEVLENYRLQNKSIILMMGHHNNWEWASQIISIVAKQDFIGIYKKLSNKFFDKLMIKVRGRFGVILVEIEDSIQYIFNNKDCKIIGLASDQNPVVNSKTYWTKFFKQDVPYILGAEKIARKMDYAVLFCNMTKESNGYYNIKFEVIKENPQNSKDGEITNKFIKRLEEKIIEEPNSYLWSHNRWKHKK